jgi:hypothetical protein
LTRCYRAAEAPEAERQERRETGPFLLVRSAGRIHSEVKVLYTPDTGKWTTEGPKEAGGKAIRRAGQEADGEAIPCHKDTGWAVSGC